MTRLTALTLSMALVAALPGAAQETTTVPTPAVGEDAGAAALPARQAAQRRAAAGYDVFHDFTFTDRVAASGITFEHHVVDDAGKYWKAVHYDHGNGLSAADVDGDGLTDLYFLTQLGGNELWRNRGDGTFENVTAKAGIAVEDRVSVAAAFGDVDNDGDPDLFVTTVRMGNLLFENRGDGTFADVTAKAGVGHVGHSSGASFFDYDRDGDLDLFVTNVGKYTEDSRRGRGGAYVGLEGAFTGHLIPERAETSLLYENRGDGTFVEVAAARSLTDDSWSGDAGVTDFDGDLWPDLYVLNMQGDDHYWQNRAGTFADRTEATFPKSPWGAMGVQFFDWNNDGRLDLYLTDMHSDMTDSYPEPTREAESRKTTWNPDVPVLQGGRNNVFGNAFWQGGADGSFEEISDRVGAENFWPWGLSAGDLNADGFQDVFIASSMNYPFRYGINSVLLNEGGERFRDAEFVLGVEPRSVGSDTQVPWYELDCSGADAADAQHFMCKGRSGRVVATGNLGTRASVILDVDGDGDQDIVTSEFNSAPQVLMSNLSHKTTVRWIEVALEGTVSNRDGLGAWVVVRAGDDTYSRYHDGKSGYLSQSLMPLYFGLGEHATVDEITVRWPSGVVQTVSGGEAGIAAGGRVELVEPRVSIGREEIEPETGDEPGAAGR